MDKITQEAYFRQRVLKYAAEHGVTASANRYRISRRTVHKIGLQKGHAAEIAFCNTPYGSPGRTRTYNPSVNSRMLCH